MTTKFLWERLGGIAPTTFWPWGDRSHGVGGVSGSIASWQVDAFRWPFPTSYSGVSGCAGTSRQHDVFHRGPGAGSVDGPAAHVSAVHGQRGCSVRDTGDGHPHHLCGLLPQVTRESAHCTPHADTDGRARGTRRQRVQRRSDLY